ncbi:MgtC/SapB family protein [Ureibacillus sp. GCM10028918]|uniref:MgtC/SapB family protein n=1 Tax=Ureibacillus sp. GCM10028918 TaxID=3273429 RepID=UPI0036152AD2
MDIIILNESLSYEIIIKLIIAATLSLIIGIERELKKKPVGLKTSLVIATFSCLLTIISVEAAYSTPPREDINITMDPLRLAAQIVSGIGFLGAGVILRKGNDSITGLTTAAMIWGAAGIGIAVGAGFYIEAFVSVVIVVVGIELIAPFLLKIGPKKIRMKELVLKALLKDEENIHNLLAFMKENDMEIENIRIRDVQVAADESLFEVDIRFSALFKSDTISIYRTLHTLSYVQKIELESLG